MMKFDSRQHQRRSIRLQGYDYTQSGAYFVTICVQNRECLFGNIANGEMRLNDAGKMIQTVWDAIPKYYPGIDIDAYQIMPNHIHGIIIIVGAGPRACPESSMMRLVSLYMRAMSLLLFSMKLSDLSVRALI